MRDRKAILDYARQPARRPPLPRWARGALLISCSLVGAVLVYVVVIAVFFLTHPLVHFP